MVMHGAGRPLALEQVARPVPGPDDVLVRVAACAVCRTDLHVIDGDLKQPKLPLIPGHEIIGTVVERGVNVRRFEAGDTVGIPWLGRTCGSCHFCAQGRENLCDAAAFTGYQIDGGYAEFCIADQNFAFAIPADMVPVNAAPLMCAGLIGYRSLRMAGAATHLGVYGFGAAAHIVTQLAVHEGRKIYAFTREGDSEAQDFARDLGAVWAGASGEAPPRPLEAAILYAPIGSLVPAALRAVEKGGTVVCAGIHMSDIPSFPYSILWGERVVRSVANLTRRDGEEFLQIAPRVPIRTEVEVHPLEDANLALERLRRGDFRGAAVLRIDDAQRQ